MKDNEKQAIEEMAKVLGDTWICDLEGNPHDLSEVLWDCDIKHIAERLYERGYRKQSEGEWIAKKEMDRTPSAKNYYCSNCKMDTSHLTKYCPNCGAHMKGGAE